MSVAATKVGRVLDGVAIAGDIKAEVLAEVQELQAMGIVPGLAVVLVGEVPASAIYVRSKVKTCGELGIFSLMLTPPETVSTAEMLDIIAELNGREDVDGILVQLPLPKHVDTKRLLEAVSPEKDVDGFHPVNAGRLQAGQGGAGTVHAGRDHGDSAAERSGGGREERGRCGPE